ncbi:MAG: MraY family glycosyltransferase [Xanthomonadales bacterium]|nr:MraY family glycosyltransferase [Xanthomonadales bacterium]
MNGTAGWLLPLLGGVATVMLCLLLMPLARHWGWIDAPDARKTHRLPTPLVGGTAIFIAFFSLVLGGGWPTEAVLPLVLASAIVLVTGLVDDRWPLGAGVRFASQAAACLVMIFWAGVRLTDFGQLFGPFTLSLGVLAVPITVFSVLGVINAFNMIDGMDGLSGSVFCIAAGGMALLAFLGGREGAAAVLLLMVGCVAGFLALNGRLPWNPRARTFLGDSGSVLLGFWLAWAFVDLGNGSREGVERVFAPMTAVWLIGVPLLDTTRLMRERWKAGRSAFDADRNHLHHAFLDAGWSVGLAWGAVVGLCLAFAAIGVAFERSGLPEYVSFYAFIGLGLVYFRVMKRQNRRQPASGQS